MNKSNIFQKIAIKRKYTILCGVIALIFPSICMIASTPIIANGLNIIPIITAFIVMWLAIFVALRYNKEINNKKP